MHLEYFFKVRDLFFSYQMVKKIFTKDEKCGLQELKESFTPDIEPMLGIRKVFSYSEVLKMT